MEAPEGYFYAGVFSDLIGLSETAATECKLEKCLELVLKV